MIEMTLRHVSLMKESKQSKIHVHNLRYAIPRRAIGAAENDSVSIEAYFLSVSLDCSITQWMSHTSSVGTVVVPLAKKKLVLFNSDSSRFVPSPLERISKTVTFLLAVALAFHLYLAISNITICSENKGNFNFKAAIGILA
uniref:Uncharacterized protein n=1 Tax=Glossina austeni TaxID=7395 RepID=A0A1A9USI4_GLOAU